MVMEKRLKIIKYISFIIGIICAALILVFYIRAKENAGINTIFVNSPDDGFSIDEIKYLEAFGGNVIFAPEMAKAVTLSYEYDSYSVQAFYINSAYFSVNNAEFLSGAPFSKTYDGNKVILLSEQTAWRIFGNIDCVGNGVYVDGVLHEVTGIIKLPESADYAAFIPYESLEDNGGNIQSFYMRDFSYNKINSYQKVLDRLEWLETDENAVNIVDLNQYADNIFLRIMFILWICLGIFILFLLPDILKCFDFPALNYRRFAVYFLLMSLSLFIIGFTAELTEPLAWVNRGRFSLADVFNNLLNLNVLPATESLSPYIKELNRLNIASIAAFFTGIVFIINFSVNRWISLRKERSVGD